MTEDGVYTVDIETECISGRQPTFTARYVEMPGCVAMGYTVEEATRALEKAREPYIGFLKRRGLDVPPPQTRTDSFVSEITISSTGAGGMADYEPKSEREKRARDVSPTLRPQYA